MNVSPLLRSTPSGWLKPATITALGPDRRLEVRLSLEAGTSEPAVARLALIAGYEPTVGDRVLVAGDEGDAFVIAVLAAAQPPGFGLSDGTRAELCDGAIEVRDAEARLLVRCREGVVEVSSPERDLCLSAPRGRVVLEAGTDVTIAAARDVSHQAGRRLELGLDSEHRLSMGPAGTELHAPRLAVKARRAEAELGRLSIAAESVTRRAQRVVEEIGHYEVTAIKLVERARDTVREVSGLARSRLGRVRSLVQGTYSVKTGRTVIVSREDTTIDGERILLG